jgi:hypothetical protein
LKVAVGAAAGGATAMRLCALNGMKGANNFPDLMKPRQEWEDKDAVAVVFHLKRFHNCCIKPYIYFFKTDRYLILHYSA